MEYKDLEKILYEYKITEMHILNLEVELSQLALPSGVSGISYEERISSGKISNQPEEAVLNKIEKEEIIKNKISSKKSLLKQVDNAMGCLNPTERQIVQDRYIEGKQWWEIAYAVKISESWCKAVRRKAIEKMLVTFKVTC